jgi:hypothetical protein
MDTGAWLRKSSVVGLALAGMLLTPGVAQAAGFHPVRSVKEWMARRATRRAQMFATTRAIEGAKLLNARALAPAKRDALLKNRLADRGFTDGMFLGEETIVAKKDGRLFVCSTARPGGP